MTDLVNHPPHYQGSNGVETIDAIEAMMSKESFIDYCRGNAVKYISRAGKKNDPAEDMDKAIWYLNRAKQKMLDHKAPTTEDVPSKITYDFREIPYHGYIYYYFLSDQSWHEYKHGEATGEVFSNKFMNELFKEGSLEKVEW